jgi:hypothetical protein
MAEQPPIPREGFQRLASALLAVVELPAGSHLLRRRGDHSGRLGPKRLEALPAAERVLWIPVLSLVIIPFKSLGSDLISDDRAVELYVRCRLLAETARKTLSALQTGGVTGSGVMHSAATL